MREFSVLLRPASEAKGQWVAHCLNWDVATQGDSPKHAVFMMAEALNVVIEEDEQEGIDPTSRPSAPVELWELFSKTQLHGTRISPADVDSLVAAGVESIAVVMYRAERSKIEGESNRVPAHTPPPFVIAALQENREARS